MLERFDPNAIARVSGPSWVALREKVLAAAEGLLSASPDARGKLTTIYVKFERPGGSVYAVMWLKKSTAAVVGLSLPASVTSPLLGPPPATMKYPTLTSYFFVTANDALPSELKTWAKAAFENID